MTRDEVIAMVREAGIPSPDSYRVLIGHTPVDKLLRFAALVEAKTKAEIKHVCNLWIDPATQNYVVDHCDHPPSETVEAYIRTSKGTS